MQVTRLSTIMTSLCFLLLSCVTAQGAETNFTTLSFEEGAIPELVTSSEAQVEVVEDGDGEGKYALKVTYGIADFPSVKFKGKAPFDFGTENCLSLDVTNPGDSAQRFYIRVDDDPEADGQKHSTVSYTDIPPHTTETVYMSFSEGALDLGMHGMPGTEAGRNVGYGWGEKSLNTANIVSFQFWMMYNKAENTLIFDNIRVIPDPSVDISYTDDIIDEYGQNTRMDWEGKITSDQDLIDAGDAEAKALADNPGDYGFSQYGGWKAGPQLEATGRFRVEKYEGKWSLVDPEGFLFFSTGLDILRLSDQLTWVSGRENMFAALPDKEGPLGDHYAEIGKVAKPPMGLSEGTGFNHYSANLERKYGENYKEVWRDVTVQRLKSWGFTSTGNWVDPELFFGKGEELKIPYVVNGWTNLGKHATVPSGQWAQVADPFDPEFRVSVQTMLEEQILTYGDIANDPWCFGAYIDNEISWGNPADDKGRYSLVLGVLALDAAEDSAHAKRAFVTALKESYQDDVAALASAWGKAFTSWDDVNAPLEFAENFSQGALKDFSALLSMYAREYFSIVDEELEKSLPGVLNLGSRFAEWGTNIEVQKAAAEFVDIVSFNVYKKGVKGEDWMYLEELNMPTIIGEFHFGSTDRGMFKGGLVGAENQVGRGRMYQAFLKSVLESPYFVGAHWFEYMDQPLLGRAWDGENNNIGFVDVTDTPYELLVEAAKEIHADAYRYRYQKVEVNSLELNQAEAVVDAAEPALQLTVKVLPEDADVQDVQWSGSDPSMALVDENGQVTVLRNGTVTVTATSLDNPAVTAKCMVTVTGFAEQEITMPPISFEADEDLSVNTAYKQAKIQYVADGATDGELAMFVEVGDLDTDYSGITFKPEVPWNWGQGTRFTADVTNPNAEDIQVRLNVFDADSQLRTFYFNIAANATQTIAIDNFAQSEDKFDGDAGWWGANSGLDQTQIKMLELYLWEDKPEATANSFIIDNIVVEKAE